ncbi:MAG: hypothetical protein LC730_00955 [Acidobacteria bacterium]|nr:hypothetical protein [Acidobacteriota bacterium]MCA1608016.1 hypothetical protein [Acidobacteriota bacterium]
MTDGEKLKEARNVLLALHKLLVDLERQVYESVHGSVTSGEFLNLLLEDKDFAWLRKFSTLIVEIDEMFSQKDGYEAEQINAHLAKVRELVSLDQQDEDFTYRYQNALQQDGDVSAKHAELKNVLG